MPYGAISVQYYSNLLCNAVCLAIHKKMPGKLSEKITVLHDNMHPYTANLTITLATLDWDIMNHPPYSPDLAFSDFHLFGPLKEHLGGQKFYMDDELKQCPELVT
jgi:histone-lysine N-methyltransferase SETMAR